MLLRKLVPPQVPSGLPLKTRCSRKTGSNFNVFSHSKIMSQRPRIIINCAASADGKTALPSRKQTRISCEEDMERVYKLRNSVDAILVGIETILSDNPKLTVKEKYVSNPKNPLRVILDSDCRTPPDALALGNDAPTLLVSAKPAPRGLESVEVMVCGDDSPKPRVDIDSMLSRLYLRGIRTLLVEGGGTVIWSFMEAGLFDELNIFVGSMVIGGAGSPTLAGGKGAGSIDEIIPLELLEARPLGGGALLRYAPGKTD